MRRRIWKWFLKREFFRHVKTNHDFKDCIFCRLPPAESLDFMSEFI